MRSDRTLITSFKKSIEKNFQFKIICNFDKNIFEMDLQTRKTAFIQVFLKLQNEEVISQFENLLKKKSVTEIDSDYFKPMSIEELNSRIDQSEEDFKNGKYKTTYELLEKYS